MVKHVALTPDGLAVAAVYPGPKPELPNVIAIADNDPRFLAWSPLGPPSPAVLTIEALADALVENGVITRAKIDAKKK